MKDKMLLDIAEEALTSSQAALSQAIDIAKFCLKTIFDKQSNQENWHYMVTILELLENTFSHENETKSRLETIRSNENYQDMYDILNSIDEKISRTVSVTQTGVHEIFLETVKNQNHVNVLLTLLEYTAKAKSLLEYALSAPKSAISIKIPQPATTHIN